VRHHVLRPLRVHVQRVPARATNMHERRRRRRQLVGSADQLGRARGGTHLAGRR
jgi:hypothetical protein